MSSYKLDTIGPQVFVMSTKLVPFFVYISVILQFSLSFSLMTMYVKFWRFVAMFILYTCICCSCTKLISLVNTLNLNCNIGCIYWLNIVSLHFSICKVIMNIIKQLLVLSRYFILYNIIFIQQTIYKQNVTKSFLYNII